MSVKAPYFADAVRADFYQGDKKLINIDLGRSRICNNNEICDAQYGETYKSCPNECPAPASQPVTSLQPATSSTTPQPNAYAARSNLVINILLLVAGIGIFIGLWWWNRRRKSQPPLVS
jgi:hypothetical protein